MTVLLQRQGQGQGKRHSESERAFPIRIPLNLQDVLPHRSTTQPIGVHSPRMEWAFFVIFPGNRNIRKHIHERGLNIVTMSNDVVKYLKSEGILPRHLQQGLPNLHQKKKHHKWKRKCRWKYPATHRNNSYSTGTSTRSHQITSTVLDSTSTYTFVA